MNRSWLFVMALGFLFAGCGSTIPKNAYLSSTVRVEFVSNDSDSPNAVGPLMAFTKQKIAGMNVTGGLVDSWTATCKTDETDKDDVPYHITVTCSGVEQGISDPKYDFAGEYDRRDDYVAGLSGYLTRVGAPSTGRRT